MLNIYTINQLLALDKATDTKQSIKKLTIMLEHTYLSARGALFTLLASCTTITLVKLSLK